jgi:20S proteasome subunit beta 7
MTPQQAYAYLSRVLYDRRNKLDPLRNTLVVAGFHLGKPFVGMVSAIGTHFIDEHIATGIANNMATPLFREFHRSEMSEQEAIELMMRSLAVCFLRDTQSINKFIMSKVTEAGVDISEPFALEPNKYLQVLQ